MRAHRRLICVSSLLLGGLVATLTQAAPNLDDSVISMRVKSALIASDATKASQINVETQRGIVQLSGFVDSEAMRAAAEAAAKRVSGVKQVQNRLLLRDANRSASDAIEDTVIAAKVKSEIAGQSGFGTATVVNVEVNSGIVELSGFLSSSEQTAKAAQIARAVPGVKDVRNNITLKPKG